MPDTEFDSLTPADIRATIARLHEQLDALPDTGGVFRAEQRRELLYQIAERTQAFHMAVRELRRRIARRETP